MIRSLFAAILALAFLPAVALAQTLTWNPFECTAPIKFLPDSLKQFQVISRDQLSTPSVLSNGEVTRFLPLDKYVFGYGATYLEMVSSGDVTSLTSHVRGSVEAVRASIPRGPNANWVCFQKTDCETGIAGVSIRVFALKSPGDAGVAISCTYNAGMRPASPARFQR